jgi:hypothetical protein
MMNQWSSVKKTLLEEEEEQARRELEAQDPEVCSAMLRAQIWLKGVTQSLHI